MQDVTQAFNEEITRKTIEELQRQRNALQKQVDALSEIVQSIPGLITSARLDAKAGRETAYDYDKAFEALYAFHYVTGEKSENPA